MRLLALCALLFGNELTDRIDSLQSMMSKNRYCGCLCAKIVPKAENLAVASCFFSSNLVMVCRPLRRASTLQQSEVPCVHQDVRQSQSVPSKSRVKTHLTEPTYRIMHSSSLRAPALGIVRVYIHTAHCKHVFQPIIRREQAPLRSTGNCDFGLCSTIRELHSLNALMADAVIVHSAR